MSEEQVVYYFDGSGGCELCELATGYYDELPEPHPHCACSYEEIVVSDGVELQIEYRNASYDEDYAQAGEEFEYDNCNSQVDADFYPILDEDEEGGISSELAEAADWEEPDSDLEADIEVAGGSCGTVLVVMERYFVTVTAEVWMSEGDRSPEYVGDIVESYAKNISVESIEVFEEDDDCFPETVPV